MYWRDTLDAVLPDAHGNFTLLGSHDANANFGGGVLPDQGGRCDNLESDPMDGFVVRYGPSGAHAGSSGFGGDGVSIRMGTGAVEPGSGELVFVYEHRENYPNPLPGSDSCLSRFTWTLEKRSAAGEMLWAQTLPWPTSVRYSHDPSVPERVFVSPEGRIEVLLRLSEPADVGDGQIRGAGRYIVAFDSESTVRDVLPVTGPVMWDRLGRRWLFEKEEGRTVVTRLASDGGTLWRKVLPPSAEAWTLAHDGTLFMSGVFQGTFDFAGQRFESLTQAEVWVASLSPEGEERWLRGYGPRAGDVAGLHVGADARGRLVLVAGGIFSLTAETGAVRWRRELPSGDPWSPLDFTLVRLGVSPSGEVVMAGQLNASSLQLPGVKYSESIGGNGRLLLLGIQL
jgi:outer membrane protein assembly factor BamB